MTEVLIVGGGVAGCLTAIQIHQLKPDWKIIIAEPQNENLVRGVAYAKHFIHQPLNVRVKGMSADPDQPEHFENWLTENQTRYPYFEFDRNSFVARAIYGDYLDEYFNSILAASNGKIAIHKGRVNSIQQQDSSYLVITNESKLDARFIVLATGNFLPKPLPVETSHLTDKHYTSNPWKKEIYENISKNEDVLIVGSGLTAVDIVLGLNARNHLGKIHLISRNGYLPLPHKDPKKHFFSDPSALLSGNIYQIFSAIREELDRIHDPEVEWQDVIDSMRAFTAKSWETLSKEHKSIFLRRLKPFWEIHRHRIPFRSLSLIDNLKSKNLLLQHQGKLERVEVEDGTLKVHYKTRDTSETIRASHIINCTGPDTDFRMQKNQLYHQLFSEMHLGTDHFHLGLACTSKGELKTFTGQILKNAYCIGSLRKGVLWETTSVSDIRMQAKEIANSISC